MILANLPRYFLFVILICGSFVLLVCRPAKKSIKETRNTQATDELIVADAHNDLSFFLSALGQKWQDCTDRNICSKSYNNPRDMYFFNIWRPALPFSNRHWYSLSSSQKQIDRLNNLTHWDYVIETIELLQTQFEIIDPTDVMHLQKRKQISGKPNIFISLEGAYLLSDTANSNVVKKEKLAQRIKKLGKMNLTYMALVWNNSNQFSGTTKTLSKGLTEDGKYLIKLLIENGILIDLSHLSDAGIEEFYTFTNGTYPLFFSHSSVRTLCGNARNVSDATLQKVKKTAGLVAINFHAPFVSCASRATKEDILAHINYIRDAYGSEFVGLGSDFDAFTKIPSGVDSPHKLRLLASEMNAMHGYSQEAIANIFSGNIFSLLGRVQKKSFKNHVLSNISNMPNLSPKEKK